MRLLLLLIAGASFALPAEDLSETDGDQSRKILGSSVVTSVSVIMDTGNGSKAVFTDAVGKPIPRPSSASELASPIDLLNPDRYEFYTFDDNGDLIKRLMSLEEIQGIIATGDSDGYDLDSFTSLGYLPEKRVNDVVNNVQNVLKEEMETHKNPSDEQPVFDTPDVSDSWSMILPAVFGNSGEDIKPEKPITHVTPDTIMIEPNMQNPYLTSTSVKYTDAAVFSSVTPMERTAATTPRPTTIISTTRSTTISQIPSRRPTVAASTPRSTTAFSTPRSTTFSQVPPRRPTVAATTPRSTTAFSTPRSTTFSQVPSRRPTVASTSAQMSTNDKLMTLQPETTTDRISSLTIVTEEAVKPLINVEIYSNSKSTENPLDQQSVENSHIVEIKPSDTTKEKVKPTYGSRITTKKPLTPTYPTKFSLKSTTQAAIKSTSTFITKENVTKPATFVTFVPSSTGSTLPTTKIVTRTSAQPIKTTIEMITKVPTLVPMPVLTTYSTEMPLSTWRPKPSSAVVTEAETITEEAPISTWRPQLTTEVTQPPNEGDQPQYDLPTLAELLNFNINADIKETTTTFTPTESVAASDLTTFTKISGEKNKDDITTTEYTSQESSQTKSSERVQTTEKSEEDDLSTLSSEYFGTKNILHFTRATQKAAETTTQLPLEQSMNTAQKMSATELLDQLLFTTNVYEINTELADKTTEQQIFSNEDERFETSTQEETKVSEIKTEVPTTTEKFVLISENTEQPTTDRSLINSIEQLISQAVGNVEDALATVNDTQKIQAVLTSSGAKNMTEVQMESATLSSDLVGSNFNANSDDEKTTTELNMLEAIASGTSSILSDSVGSLLSQVYEGNPPSMTTIEPAITTEKYSSTVIKTTAPSNRKTDDVTVTLNALPVTEQFEPETSTADENDKFTNLDAVFESQKITTTTVAEFETEKSTTIEPTTVGYMPLDLINKNNISNFSSEDFVPHLINITIISGNANRTKPAKADVSLEQMFDEEYIRNSSVFGESLIGNKGAVTNIDQTASSVNENINVQKIPNEILKAEETMSALYNYTEASETTTEITTNEPQSNSSVVADTTSEVTTDETTLATTESIAPVKELPKVNQRPTTIIIIKRTERPLIESTTVPAIEQNDNTNINLDTTTELDEENSEPAAYGKKGTEKIELVTERMSPATTEVDASSIEPTEITTKPEPFVEIVVDENVNSLTKRTEPIDQTVQITTPFSIDRNNKTDTENKTPQESSNINVKLSNEPGNLKKVVADQKPSQNDKFNKSDASAENNQESTWTLVPTIAPHSDDRDQNNSHPNQHFPEIIEPPPHVDLVAKPLHGFGLEESTSRLDADIYQFVQLCNELAFGFWKTVTNGISTARSVFVSPFGATSLLAMVFLGAKGATSGEMNEILRLDDMVTFNPHLIFKNISESIKTEEPESGVASSAIIRELFSDRSKGKLLPFYKERARAFYDGYVEEASFREIGDVIRRRTNLQVKKYTNGKTAEFLKDSSITARSPLAGVSVNLFQTDCSQASTDGRDGELHFVVLPSIRQRRLIPVPAVVYKSGFLAGYEASLDATAVSLGTKDQIVSTILVIPGQQGIAAPGDGLARLEKRLVESSFKKGAWSRLLRSLIPRPGLEVQIPRFSHRSIINATVALKRMGLHDLFDVEKADLRGLNGVANELFLSDMLQINSFATCGEKTIGGTHHIEVYPASASRARSSRYLENYQSEDTYYRSDLLEEPRDYQRAFPDPLHDPNYLSLPLPLRPRQARVPEIPRLRFDRPFIYFVRHNPTGLILHMGRFNPRLLP